MNRLHCLPGPRQLAPDAQLRCKIWLDPSDPLWFSRRIQEFASRVILQAVRPSDTLQFHPHLLAGTTKVVGENSEFGADNQHGTHGERLHGTAAASVRAAGVGGGSQDGGSHKKYNIYVAVGHK